ncbi:hypothetical protein FisN_6Lh102 [Fistulifera solaris]|uniref:BAH domain-containing protein n=1 Tax=Fistulifera solaris TaxID=1519565 RepID=A0A1Z5J6E4_FISSO|nr:hypothetical protein FisN_6Lh102 [Fistulifera solaris]|eukprot:GAX09509.1 hypothetical protein FisN_6Lh102 [Fistulifera solaris]
MTTSNKRNSSSSSSAGPAKRPRRNVKYACEWTSPGTDAGELFDPDTLEYESVRLQSLDGKDVLHIRIGQVVQLLSSGEELWICRVEHLFQTAGADPQFRGRWFYGEADLQRLLAECQDEGEERALEDLCQQLGDSELVLSNVEEDNPLASIADIRIVQYEPDLVSPHQFLCRHCLDWDSESKFFSIRPINDSDKSSSNEKDTSQEEDDEEDDDDENSQSSKSDDYSHVIQEGEGSTRRGDIQVGDNYQASVGPFVPNQKVVSRRPKLWWKPGCIADDNLKAFSDKVAAIQTPFLLENNMASEEPYTPLSTSRAREFVKYFPEGEILTASHMSSACIALGKDYSKLFKECDIDEVISVLAESDFNASDAISFIQKDHERISSAWTATEREIFDLSYRRNHGNLRIVAQDLMTKTMKQVVDYFYRFKIPDQFRLYQNKKREQAMYLMDCIDKRRRGLPIPAPKFNESDGESDDENTKIKSSQWQEHNADEGLQSVDRRYNAAKKLLHEVYSQMGEDIFMKVAAAVRKLRTSYDRTLKESILRELKGHPDLQRRFLDFLPRDV